MPKISALPPIGTLAVDDEVPVVDDSTATTSKMTLADVLKAMYPVGSLYYNADVSTNPGTLLGIGTWAAFAAGRVPVGVGTSDQAFAAGATGGASTHTLSTAEIPAHNHNFSGVNAGSGNNGSSYPWVADNTNRTPATANTGGGGAHNNLQPYVVVYIWRRTA